jgi:ectoine hydroxylase-related dioxygenase (phytanoyl-CoA dioxygenase family)
VGKVNFKEIDLIEFSTEELEQINESLLVDGYFTIDPKKFQLPILDMANAITEIKSRNMLPVYAFVYDEFYSLFFKLHNLLSSILGKDYKMLPAMWAWHIDNLTEEYGWKPHRDRHNRSLDQDGKLKSLTIWIPLTDATTLNGCMYIVPASRDPAYNTGDDRMRFKYQDIRALPASAGSILGWTQEAMHWGSHSSKNATAPRISISVEFQRGDVDPFETPLIDPFTNLSLTQRIMLINQQISKYRTHELSKQ